MRQNKYSFRQKLIKAHVNTSEERYIDTEEKRNSLFVSIRQEISNKFSDDLLKREGFTDSSLDQQIVSFINNYLIEQKLEFATLEEQNKFIHDFLIDFSGYGILQSYINDESIEEIYILGYDKIYINRAGNRILTDAKFKSPEHLKSFIDNILASVNRRVDSLQPIEDAHLPDYNRIAVSGDVLSPQGFTMNIRKFRKEKITLEDMIKYGTLTREISYIINALVDGKFNCLVSGGTASGKTTLLNAMADFFPEDEFVITVEDNLELQLGVTFCLQLETRKANVEGKGEITMNDLFKHCLRRSPNRFVIGEIRDGKVANTFISAANTGHDGCLATVHSNSPEMCRTRISRMIANETGEPIEAAEKDFNEAIQAVIQIKMLKSKKRVLSGLTCFLSNGETFDWVKFDELNNDWIIRYDIPEEIRVRLLSYGVNVVQFMKDFKVLKPIATTQGNFQNLVASNRR